MPRILIIRGGAIGDFLLTLPAIRLVREGFPDCDVEILGYRHIAALAEGRYYARAVRSIEYGPLASFFNPRADLDPELCAYFGGFQQVISYLYDPDGLFETCLRRAGVKNLLVGNPKIDDSGHAATQLARPLAQMALWLDDPAARIFPSADDERAADRALAGVPDGFLAVHPGSGGEAKMWPLENWIRLLGDFAVGRDPGRLVLVGGESDTARLATLRQVFPQAHFLENLPLPVLGAVLARARGFVGHDSGISHLAAAAGTRCLLLFGPTDPDIWAPANPAVTVMTAPDGMLSRLEVSPVLDKIVALHGF
jgi:heptosyltransferase-2